MEKDPVACLVMIRGPMRGFKRWANKYGFDKWANEVLVRASNLNGTAAELNNTLEYTNVFYWIRKSQASK